ncbi:MAG: hypothetical protein IT363_01035 [Methanoregulaceae archaeon]|jgi:uncharacterized protein YxjI|nr:hypothetical protein [Methanoregulaceae archaeon]
MITPPPAAAHAFAHSHYLLKRQFFKLMGSNLRVYDPGGNLVLFVHQKAFRLREDIRVYTDESKSREILTIQARQIIDFSAAYDVTDALSGVKVGALRRKGWSSLLRDSWEILDAHDIPIGKVTEDNMTLAMIRRLLVNLIPQSYDVVATSGQKIADFHQRFNPFLYNLDIDFRMDTSGLLDRRLGLGAAVLLAAIEGRQSG